MVEQPETLAFIGLVMPIIIAAINDARWSDRTRSLVGIGVCLAATVVLMVWNGETAEPEAVFKSFGIIYATSIASYYGVYKPTGVSRTVESRVFQPQNVPAPPEEPKDDSRIIGG